MRIMKALIMALISALLLSMLPVGIYAEDGDGSCSVIAIPDIAAVEVHNGATKAVDLDQIFTDDQGHQLVYSIAADTAANLHPVLEDNILRVYPLGIGDYEIEVTASCADGGSIKATIPFSVVVSDDEGDPAQYNYDEEPAEYVTVYATFSSDGIPLIGKDTESTVLSHVAVQIPYFDLEEYGLSQYYRYHTADGSGPYVDSDLIERPTAMHFFIYMTERYYMGIDEEDCGKGKSTIMEYDDPCTMLNMYGDTAYDAVGRAYEVTQAPLQSFMTRLWGHDENMMYYRNHWYPLQSPGIGATADYMLLSDYDVMDVAFFTNWGFFDSGAFCCFDKEAYDVHTGKKFTFQTKSSSTGAVSEGGHDELVPTTGLNIEIYDENWNFVSFVDSETSEYKFTLNEPGFYHLVGMDYNAGTNKASMAPAGADIYVSESSGDENEAPKRKDGVQELANLSIREQKKYSINMEELFYDPDDDEMAYKVAIDGADPQQINVDYEYNAGEAGTHTLVFTPTDSKGLSGETYTVNLTVTANKSPEYAVSEENEQSVTILYTETTRLDMLEIFQDKDGDDLKYLVSSDGGDYEEFEPVEEKESDIDHLYFEYSPADRLAVGDHVFRFKAVDDLQAESGVYIYNVNVDIPASEKDAIEALQTAIEALDGKIDALQDTVDAAATAAALTDVQDAVDAIAGQLSDLKDTVDALPAEAASKKDVEDAIAALETKLDTLSASVATKAALDTAVSTLEGKIAALQEKVDALPTSAATMEEVQDAIDVIAGEIAALKEQVGNLPASAATKKDVEDAIGTLDSKLDAITSSIVKKSEFDAAIGAINEKLDALANSGASKEDMETAIAELKQQIGALPTSAATKKDVEDAINELNAKIEALPKTTLSKEDIQSMLKVLEDKIDAITASKETTDELRMQLEALSAEVTTLKKAAAKNNKVSGLKAVSSKKKFTVSWTKNETAEGYDVQYRLKTSKKFKTLKKGVTTTSVKSKKLKKNKKYVFRVRTYETVGGVKIYGKWVKTKAVKCK